VRFCLVADESWLEPPYGGIGTRTKRASHALAGAGHDVTVVTLTYNGRATDTHESGIHVIALPYSALSRGLPGRIRVRLEPIRRMAWFAVKSSQTVRNLERAAPFDLVCYSSSNGTALLARSLLRSPVLIELSSKHRKGMRPSERVLKAFFERAAARRCDIFAVNDPSLLSHAKSLSPGARHAVLPLITPAQDWGNSADADRPAWDPNLILFAAKGLSPVKGTEVLGQAFSRVSRAVPSARLLVVGDDRRIRGRSAREILSELAGDGSKQISFAGFLAPQKLRNEIAGAAVVAIPSLSEALPNICVEALHVGTPVVGTQGNGMESLVHDGINGFLVPPGEPQMFARALIASLSLDRTTARNHSQTLLRAHEPDAYLRAFLELVPNTGNRV
jgi:glycosyltransferase involved in cell wall biosynthesis